MLLHMIVLASLLPENMPDGLTAVEAQARLTADGHNELPSDASQGMFTVIFEVLREPMFLLLISAGGIYLALGDVREALMLLFFVAVVMGITLFQQRKTDRVLRALRNLSSPRALVMRDGQKLRVAGRDVVRDDIIVLSEGDRVPADALLVVCNSLHADESLLTGEPVPVSKLAWDGEPYSIRPGGDDLPLLFSGTLIVQGQGIARVTATGARTEIGRIGKSLQTLGIEPSPLQQETRRLVKILSLIAIALCAVVVILYGLTRGTWLEALLAGIALAMSILPEEFPMVLTVFLALGAWRISRHNVLTRRVPALEALGAATVLCADKTGTITENRMTVTQLVMPDATFQVDYANGGELPEPFHALVEFSVLASLVDAFDPMEKAFKKLAEHYLAGTEHLHTDWMLAHQYPLSRDMLAMSHAWKSAHRDEYVVAAKGAPEAIVDLCHLSPAERDAIATQVNQLATHGLRVLAMARATFSGAAWPPQQHDFPFTFLGMIALVDPVRAEVPAAIQLARRAGIKVAMITGDYPATAQAVAREAGISIEEGVLTGAEIDALSAAELQTRISTIRIFARVVPEQKLRLVQAFKSNGEVVAMTGDGVNDAPALKAAHIGIAMGGRGTDVAREAASLVLLDDNFATIVAAIRLGRRIFDNLHKAMAYILAVHVPIAGMTLIPLLFGLPLVLFPAHIVFLELVINSACAIVFEAEPEERGIMDRPPRRPDAPLFSRGTLLIALLQGVTVLTAVALVYAIALHRGQSADESRALAFTTLVIGNLSLILTNRSWSRTLVTSLFSPNPALWWVLGGTISLLALILSLPGLRALFGFAALRGDDLLLSLAAGGSGILWFELFKLVTNRRSLRDLPMR
jgi:Ca2+-transporting ATPase